MLAVLIVLVAVLLVGATVMDARSRRHGHRIRGAGDIAAEIRQQRIHMRGRRSVGYNRTGDEGADGTYPVDRSQRLGRGRG